MVNYNSVSGLNRTIIIDSVAITFAKRLETLWSSWEELIINSVSPNFLMLSYRLRPIGSTMKQYGDFISSLFYTQLQLALLERKTSI
jgi:hypothetical protein